MYIHVQDVIVHLVLCMMFVIVLCDYCILKCCVQHAYFTVTSPTMYLLVSVAICPFVSNIIVH